MRTQNISLRPFCCFLISSSLSTIQNWAGLHVIKYLLQRISVLFHHGLRYTFPPSLILKAVQFSLSLWGFPTCWLASGEATHHCFALHWFHSGNSCLGNTSQLNLPLSDCFASWFSTHTHYANHVNRTWAWIKLRSKCPVFDEHKHINNREVFRFGWILVYMWDNRRQVPTSCEIILDP